jgi:hypothetical protein
VGIFKKKDNSLGWLKMLWVNSDTTKPQQSSENQKKLHEKNDSDAREIYQIEQAKKASL